MRGVVLGAGAALAVALAGAPSAAAVIFSDSFEGETITDPAAGASLNYASFANFFVGEGSVDLLGTPNGFGLVGDGKYVDLDGSSGDGGYLETIPQFDFVAGDIITLSFRGSGNQRGGTDGLFAGFRFFGPTVLYSHLVLNGLPTSQAPTTPSQLLLGVEPALASGSPYQTYSISFTAETAGRFTALIGTDSNDNVGPLIDDVVIENIPVPEPAAWAMMITGFGLAGVQLRRRRLQRA